MIDIKDRLLYDKDTNVVFLSTCLNTKKYGNPGFYKEFDVYAKRKLLSLIIIFVK